MNVKLKLWLPIILWLWLYQVLQDVAGGSGSDPVTDASSLSDAHLMFEFLLNGVEINQDNNVFLLDEELASMRKGKEFLSRINDGIPLRLRAIQTMVQTMKAQQKTSLDLEQFERLVLCTVYSALQVRVQPIKEEREAWSGVLVQLANITTRELRGSFLYNYT